MISEKDITTCGHGSGTPSLVNLSTYNSSRYASVASNGVRKGIICVRRLKALNDDGRKRFHDTYSTIIGRNLYNQNRRDYCYKPYKDGKYYSDCSSSGCLTFNKIGYTNVPSLNTAGIYTSSLFETVPVNISNGHITNPEILKVGDALLYIGNDPSRPKQIGHVQFVYEIIKSTSDSFVELQMTADSMGIKIMSNLNIRSDPSSTASIVGSYSKGTTIYPTSRTTINDKGWFRTDKGWVSAVYCYGWVRDANNKWWYLKNTEKYEWYQNCIASIDGKDYGFNKNGYMIVSSDINPDGSINS